VLSSGVACIGFGLALIDVSMNAHAVCVERHSGLNVLGMLQALNSVGSLAGVLIGGLFAAYNITPFRHFARFFIS